MIYIFLLLKLYFDMIDLLGLAFSERSLLRISLAHRFVSCKIVDIESEDDLLCTRASPCPCCCCPVGLGFIWVPLKIESKRWFIQVFRMPLSMLSRKQKPNLWLIFTILDACFLYDVFVFLDLRNANINSRFVSKGPINKLLNNIAMSFGSASDIEKQNRSQIYPLFLEPSKTFVEFKVKTGYTSLFITNRIGFQSIKRTPDKARPFLNSCSRRTIKYHGRWGAAVTGVY
uniref:Uncharacterized protein n=1 Tax=Solanum lycopersicum TaxID=4081 RepID=A0A3Q7F8W7_SOLLC